MLPENLTIRSVLFDDAQALLQLRLEALQDSPEAFGEDYEFVLAQPYKTWADLVANSLGEGDRVIFVADVQGKICNAAWCRSKSLPEGKYRC